jgi:hypothetical protein
MMDEHLKHDAGGHVRFQFSVPEMVGIGTGVVAVVSAASLWLSLPHRVNSQEEQLRDHSQALRQLQGEFSLRNEKMAALVAVVESIDRRTQRIEQQIVK